MGANPCKSWIVQNTTRIRLGYSIFIIIGEIQLDQKDQLLCKECGEEFFHHVKIFHYV
jgi:hypothetical protein